MRGGVQGSTESSREASTSQRRGWLPRGPVFTIFLLVVAITVAAAAGAALASLFSGAPTELPAEVAGIGAPSDSSPEAGFARDMMVHHAQAVEMAEIVRDKTGSEEIRTLAADIALTQQAQIGQMQGWLQVWDLPPTGTEPAMSWMGEPHEGRMPGMASPEEINDLQQASPEEAETLFLQLMVPHHEAAVPMAQAVLEETDRKEVERLAGSILASQQAEIELMRGLLQRRGVTVEDGEGEPDPGRPSHHADGHSPGGH
jgi:uncharacterized protein (DUF305 family)